MEPLNPTWVARIRKNQNEAVPRHHGGVCVFMHRKLRKWNTRVGLRYEYTRMGLLYYIGDYENFTSHLNDLVPNVAVSYRLGDASNLRLAYQMKYGGQASDY